MHKRSLTIPIAALVVGTGLTVLAPGSAYALDCSAPRENNGETWTQYVIDDNAVNGGVVWHEHGDWLQVRDNTSNGLRTVARFQWCSGSQWQPVHEYDSGSDEGDVDQEIYDMNFKERRRVKFQACETDGFHKYHCSNTQWANA